MSPIFMSPDAAQQATCDHAMISTLTKDLGNEKRVILAVNRCIRPLDAKLQLAGLKPGSATARYENRSVPISDGQIRDKFEPYGVHIYEVNSGQ
jgi:hypothetical protein